jgi:hypothetical protein
MLRDELLVCKGWAMATIIAILVLGGIELYVRICEQQLGL